MKEKNHVYNLPEISCSDKQFKEKKMKKILRIIERIFNRLLLFHYKKSSIFFRSFIICINMQTASFLLRVLCETNYKNWSKSRKKNCLHLYALAQDS